MNAVARVPVGPKATVGFAMSAFFPPTDGLPGLADLDVTGFVDDLQREVSSMYWSGVVMASMAFVASPIVTIGVPLPAWALSEEQLDRHANKMSSSSIYPVRQAAFLVRLTAGMMWGADPTVRAHFGLKPYGPDPGTFRS